MADMAHLIEPVIPALRRYARTFVRDAADADDLVQDTLERAISRWHQPAIRRRNAYMAFHHPAQPGGQSLTAGGGAGWGGFPRPSRRGRILRGLRHHGAAPAGWCPAGRRGAIPRAAHLATSCLRVRAQVP